MRTLIILSLFFLIACTPAPGPKTPNPIPGPSPSASDGPTPGELRQAILEVAGSSACAKYSFKERGKPYPAFIKGMALTYGRALCRLKKGDPIAKLTSQPYGSEKDVLTWYGLKDPGTPDGRLKLAYQLGIGLGMMESNGRYCCGADASATNYSHDTAEAGMFQASYNSIRASTVLPGLYSEYQQGKAKCEFEVWKDGVPCYLEKNLGTGPGVEWQHVTKSCPSFAAEYAMGLIRVLRNHFGPLNRKKAEVVPACGELLDYVELTVNRYPEMCSVL